MTHSLRLWNLLALITLALLLSTPTFAADDGITDLSIVSIPPFAGQMATHELAFVATRELTSAQVQVEYPADFNLSATKLPLSSTRTGQTILFSVPRAISAGERVIVRADQVINPTAPGTFSLLVSTGADSPKVAKPLFIGGADGAVTVAWVESSNLLPGATGSHALNFIATNGLPAGGTIRIEYPPGFNLTGATLPPNDVVTMQEVTGQTIVYRVARSYRAGEFFGAPVPTEGIVNPTSTATRLLKVSTSSDPTPVHIPHTVRPGGSVRGVSLQVSSITAGRTATYSLKFEPATGLPVGSTVSLEFPPGLTPAAASFSDSLYALESITGQTVTLRVLQGANAWVYHPAPWLTAPAGSGEVTIAMKDLVNPSAPGTYDLKLWTSNDPEKVSLPIFITRPVLSISFAGSGGGSVNGTFSCQWPALCSFATPESSVSLIPTPSSDSVFAGWSGACTGANANCELLMDRSKSVTAIFNLADKIRILGRPYQTLAAAFAEAASGTVEARATEFTETVTVSRPARFKGGFDSQFASNSGGFSVLNGTLTIGAGGSLVCERLVIR